MVTIREVTSADWPALWPIIRAVAEAGETYAYPQLITEQQAQALWFDSGSERIVVAIGQAGEVLGSAKMGANRAGPGSHVATASFMVSPDIRGRGIGRMLGEEVLAWARREKFLAMQFNAVVASNAAAVHLWAKLGFKVVGSVPDAFRHPTLAYMPLLIMHRFL